MAPKTLSAFLTALALAGCASPGANPPAPTPAPARPPAAAPAAAKAAPGFAGYWTGAIIRTLGKDEIDFDLELIPPPPGGGWTAKMSVPTTGMKDRLLDRVAVDGPTITFEQAVENGRRVYQGKLSGDGNRIVGEYTRGTTTFPFELDRLAGPRKAVASPLTELSPDARELKQLFDQERDKVRLVLLLSPT